MARVDRPVRCLGVLEGRWHPDYLSGLTTATERDPRPGDATTESTLPRLDPRIVGAQSQTVIVEVLQGGYPQLGGTSLGVGYYLADEATADARGFMVPITVQDWRSITATSDDPTTGQDAAYDPLTGRVMLRCADALALFDPHTDALTAITDPTDVDWSGLAVAYMQDGTGRAVIAGLDYAAVSDDHGATWVQVGGGTRDTFTGSPTWRTGSELHHFRLCPDGTGNLLWMGIEDVGGSDSDPRFAASDDNGVSWTEIVIDTSGTETSKYFDMSPHPDGGIAFVSIINDGGDCAVRFWMLPNAYTSLDDVDAVTVIPTVAGSRALVHLACDTNGVIWLYMGVSPSSLSEVEVYFSTDRGLTWTQTSDHWNAAINAPLGRLCPHPYGGLAMSAALDDASVGLAQLGGWTAPGRRGNDWAEVSGTRSDLVYLGPALPTAYGMTSGGTGGGDSSGPGYFVVRTLGVAATRWYDADIETGAVDAASAEAIVSVATGSTDRACKIRLVAREAGVTQRRVSIELSDDEFRVYDEVGSAVLSGPHAVDLTLPTHFRLSFDGATGRVMWKQTPSTLWEQAALTGIATDTGAASDGASVRFGVLDSTTGTELNVWKIAARAIDADRLQGLNNVGIGATVYPCPDAHDATRERAAYLTIRGGPSLPGELHTIPPSYGYPLSATFPTVEPSPSRPWRTAAALSADEDCLVDLGVDSDPGLSPSVALVIRNANVRRIDLLAMEHGGSSVSVVETLDLATGFTNLDYALDGNRLSPAGSSTAGARYLRKNELAGCVAILAGPESYRISGNTAGWFDATASVPACVYLEGVDPDDPPASSGTVDLVWHSGVLVYHQAPGVVYRYWGWRVRSGNKPPDAEGYAQIGNAYLFGLAALGKQWSNGEEIRAVGNVRSTVDDAGTERRQQLGPTKRELSIVWDDGARQARSIRREDGVDADYLGPDGVPLVARDDVAGQLTGVLEGAKGGALPVLVVLAPVGDASGGVATETITDASLWLVGYAQEVRDTHAIVDDQRGGAPSELVRNSIGTIVEAV